MSQEDFKEEIKKMMKEVMKEQMEEMQAVNAASSQDPKPKKSPKSKGYTTKWDNTRTMKQDARDPRSSQETWPCFGEHKEVEAGNNRFGKCGLRLEHVPAVNASAQTTKTMLPMNVQEALHRLRQEGWKAEELKANVVTAAIEVVARNM